MAQPGTPTPSPVPSGHKQDRILNFRVDSELQEAIDAFAADAGIGRSEACRILISTALGQPAHQAAAREAVFTFSGYRRRLVHGLLARIKEVLPDLLEAEDVSFAEAHPERA